MNENFISYFKEKKVEDEVYFIIGEDSLAPDDYRFCKVPALNKKNKPCVLYMGAKFDSKNRYKGVDWDYFYDVFVSDEVQDIVEYFGLEYYNEYFLKDENTPIALHDLPPDRVFEVLL